MHLSTNFGKEIREKKSPGTNGLTAIVDKIKNKITTLYRNIVFGGTITIGLKKFLQSIFEVEIVNFMNFKSTIDTSTKIPINMLFFPIFLTVPFYLQGKGNYCRFS